MKKLLSYLFYWALIVLLLPACSQDDDAPTASNRTMTLNINVNTRALSQADGMPGKLQLWVYGNEYNNGVKGQSVLLLYREYDKVNWKYVSNAAPEKTEFTSYFPAKVELKEKVEYKDLRVYAVVNADKATWTAGSELAADISEDDLMSATFTAASLSNKDNEVLMFAQNTIDVLIEDERKDVTLEARRCVAKLELYFTQRSPEVDLKIQSIMLSKFPDKGYLVPPADWTSMGGEGGVKTIFTPVEEAANLPIMNVLTGTTAAGDFSTVYDNAPDDSKPFTQITVAEPYLLEREGQKWLGIVGKDDIYPNPDDDTNSYLLTLNYQYNRQGTVKAESKVLALSRIERNTRYRIFIRVHTDTPVEVNTVTVPWVWGKGDLNIDFTPGLEDEGVQ